MKMLVIFAVSVFATGAMACPQLAGKYICDYDGDLEETVLSQSVNNGITTYVIDSGDEIIADGNEYPMNDDTMTATYVARCVGTAYVHINMKGSGGSRTFDIDTHLIKDKTDGILTFRQTGTVVIDGTEYPFKETTICRTL